MPPFPQAIRRGRRSTLGRGRQRMAQAPVSQSLQMLLAARRCHVNTQATHQHTGTHNTRAANKQWMQKNAVGA